MRDYTRLLELLKKGESNAISQKNLAIGLNCSERWAQKEVADARRDGIIICSGNAGYYLPETDEELLATYNRLHAHGVGVLSVLKATRSELQRRGFNIK